MKDNAVFAVLHDDTNLRCVELYGVDYLPAFKTRGDAERFMAACEAAWGDDAPARKGYFIEKYSSLSAIQEINELAEMHNEI